MLYLNHTHLEGIGADWPQLIAIIEDAAGIMHDGDYAQPVKPYLRFGDRKNRIIAMPAYAGGDIRLAGIKWIASFPDNLQRSIPRAHSVTILNDSLSGKPLCIINTNMVSAIRTAAVSGLVIREYIRKRDPGQKFTVGIIGFGPIGRTHLNMITAILDGSLGKVNLFDLKGIDKDSFPEGSDARVAVCGSWEECYEDADIFITCTVSDKPYIDKAPKKGSLQLNVSLRDYKPETRKYMDIIVVDDWEEVCRQNTDIENMHKTEGLQQEDSISIAELVREHRLDLARTGEVTMFNPMGMAIFDIAIGGYFYCASLQKNMGLTLPE